MRKLKTVVLVLVALLSVACEKVDDEEENGMAQNETETPTESNTPDQDKPDDPQEPQPGSNPQNPAEEGMGFVLAEIFCAGTPTPQGTYYDADKYFVVYNNTDHVLYADSLCIAESEFVTVMKVDYVPNITNDYLAVSAIYMIPGSGKDYPVESGGRLLIVANAINHNIHNPNSWDFQTADFEWYDISDIPQYVDSDNPNVPNLVRYYAKTNTFYSPNSLGTTAFALVRMPVGRAKFLTDYYYEYSYRLTTSSGSTKMVGDCYKVPNSWVVDAVNCSIFQNMQWLVTTPTLDSGYAYISISANDTSRYGKAMRRKLDRVDGTRIILKDTNNSTNDFESRVTADPFFVF